MATFLETPRFPDDIAYGSRGGPLYSTSVFTGSSGREKRNINWAFPKHQFNVGYGARNVDKIYDLVEFYHSVRGPGIGFRYKDFGDYKSCKVTQTPTEEDQVVASIDGSDTVFQLIKQYATGTLIQHRLIQKPIEGTILVSVGGVSRVEGTDYTIDYTTGIITFVAPQTVTQIKWGGEFDVPCRFEEDSLPISYNDFQHGSADVNILEIMVDAELIQLPEECDQMTDYPLTKIRLPSGQSLAIPTDYQLLVYREFIVEDGATLEIETGGELIVLDEDV